MRLAYLISLHISFLFEGAVISQAEGIVWCEDVAQLCVAFRRICRHSPGRRHAYTESNRSVYYLLYVQSGIELEFSLSYWFRLMIPTTYRWHAAQNDNDEVGRY